MLRGREKQQIIGALKQWASSVPNKRMLGFAGSNFLTPKEIVQAALEETEDGLAILEILEHGVRREGIESVTKRLTRRHGSTGTASSTEPPTGPVEPRPLMR
jgi:hypothetical protein